MSIRCRGSARTSCPSSGGVWVESGGEDESSLAGCCGAAAVSGACSGGGRSGGRTIVRSSVRCHGRRVTRVLVSAGSGRAGWTGGRLSAIGRWRPAVVRYPDLVGALTRGRFQGEPPAGPCQQGTVPGAQDVVDAQAPNREAAASRSPPGTK